MSFDFGEDAPLPERKEKVRIKIKKEEREYYSKLFEAAKTKGTNKASINNALAFFTKSKLSGGMVKKICAIAAQTNPGEMDRDEFYVALRLIALAQCRREVSLAAIANNIESPLPFIESFPMPAVTQGPMQGGYMPMQMHNTRMMGP